MTARPGEMATALSFDRAGKTCHKARKPTPSSGGWPRATRRGTPSRDAASVSMLTKSIALGTIVLGKRFDSTGGWPLRQGPLPPTASFPSILGLMATAPARQRPGTTGILLTAFHLQVDFAGRGIRQDGERLPASLGGRNTAERRSFPRVECFRSR